MSIQEPNFARALLQDPRVNVFINELKEKQKTEHDLTQSTISQKSPQTQIIIRDRSISPSYSVNDGIQKDNYMYLPSNKNRSAVLYTHFQSNHHSSIISTTPPHRNNFQGSLSPEINLRRYHTPQNTVQKQNFGLLVASTRPPGTSDTTFVQHSQEFDKSLAASYAYLKNITQQRDQQKREQDSRERTKENNQSLNESFILTNSLLDQQIDRVQSIIVGRNLKSQFDQTYDYVEKIINLQNKLNEKEQEISQLRNSKQTDQDLNKSNEITSNNSNLSNTTGSVPIERGQGFQLELPKTPPNPVNQIQTPSFKRNEIENHLALTQYQSQSNQINQQLRKQNEKLRKILEEVQLNQIQIPQKTSLSNSSPDQSKLGAEFQSKDNSQMRLLEYSSNNTSLFEGIQDQIEISEINDTFAISEFEEYKHTIQDIDQHKQNLQLEKEIKEIQQSEENLKNLVRKQQETIEQQKNEIISKDQEIHQLKEDIEKGQLNLIQERDQLVSDKQRLTKQLIESALRNNIVSELEIENKQVHQDQTKLKLNLQELEHALQKEKKKNDEIQNNYEELRINFEVLQNKLNIAQETLQSKNNTNNQLKDKLKKYENQYIKSVQKSEKTLQFKEEIKSMQQTIQVYSRQLLAKDNQIYQLENKIVQQSQKKLPSFSPDQFGSGVIIIKPFISQPQSEQKEVRETDQDLFIYSDNKSLASANQQNFHYNLVNQQQEHSKSPKDSINFRRQNYNYFQNQMSHINARSEQQNNLSPQIQRSIQQKAEKIECQDAPHCAQEVRQPQIIDLNVNRPKTPEKKLQKQINFDSSSALNQPSYSPHTNYIVSPVLQKSKSANKHRSISPQIIIANPDQQSIIHPHVLQNNRNSILFQNSNQKQNIFYAAPQVFNQRSLQMNVLPPTQFRVENNKINNTNLSNISLNQSSFNLSGNGYLIDQFRGNLTNSISQNQMNQINHQNHLQYQQQQQFFANDPQSRNYRAFQKIPVITPQMDSSPNSRADVNYYI